MSLIGNNSLIPGAPEFGKGWKQENNGGCPCNCTILQPVKCTTIIQHFTRYSQSDSLVDITACVCNIVTTDEICPSPQLTDVDCSSMMA